MRHAARSVRIAAALLAVVTAGIHGAANPGSERHRLTLRNGAVAIAIGPVERRDGVLLFRTPDGVLASVREDSVASVEVVPSGSEAGRRPAKEPTPADRGSVPEGPVLTNEDLPAGRLPSVVGAIVGPDGRPIVGDDGDRAAPVPLSYDTYVDREGRGEAWWRAAIADLDAERERAAGELERWSRRLSEISSLVAVECVGARLGSLLVGPRCAELLAIREEARDRLDEARSRLDEVEAERRGLSEEARRAGALPGWLR